MPVAPKTTRGAFVDDANIEDYFRNGQEQLKKGRVDDALITFRSIFDYTRDVLALLECVRGPYEKAVNDPGLDQNQKEDLYVKSQRIGTLSTKYTVLKGESAYHIGYIYSRKGDAEQARRYLLDACQSLPFSLKPDSIWLKAKNLLLGLFRLEGEF